MAQSPGEGWCENLKLAKVRVWKGQSWDGLLGLQKEVYQENAW